MIQMILYCCFSYIHFALCMIMFSTFKKKNRKENHAEYDNTEKENKEKFHQKNMIDTKMEWE